MQRLGHQEASPPCRRSDQAFLNGCQLCRCNHASAAEAIDSTTSGRRIAQILSGGLREALRLGVVERNVSLGVRLPADVTPEIEVWSAAEARQVLVHVAGDAIYGGLDEVGLATLLRPGELRALLWRDIDLAGQRIIVWRTMTKGANGRETIGPRTKGKRERAVVLMLSAVAALQRQAERQRSCQREVKIWCVN